MVVLIFWVSWLLMPLGAAAETEAKPKAAAA
jgi:hypothetical protein